MSKERKQKNPPLAEKQGRGADEPAPPALWLRVAISIAVAWHVFVVFISPLSVPPASQLVVDVAQSKLVRWYTDSLYLNHGYHFFGPEPPINQLVRYEVIDAAGELVAKGEFPDKEAQRPRLYYHRHMMLADQASLGPPDIAPDDWMRFSMRAYGRHLLRVHGGDRVRVDCVRHNLLFPTQSLRGDKPNAPHMFEHVLSVDETASGLAEPLPIPAPPPPQEPLFEPEVLPPGEVG